MKDWAPILKLARYRLLVLIRALILTGSLCLGSVGVWQYLQVKLTRMQDQLTSIQSMLTEREKDLSDINASIVKYRKLKRVGMIGSADREAWVEHLVATRKRLGLPDTLAFTMKPPVTLDSLSQPEQAAGNAGAGFNPEAALVHDLDFELLGIHEGELLSFLHEFQTTVRGRSRVESCRLTDAREAGLVARCTVRFFTLPEPSPSPGAAVS